MRSAALWALSEAGKRSPEEIVRIAAEAGYDISPLEPRLEQARAEI
jgi:sulfide:quinone oxidoreductase